MPTPAAAAAGTLPAIASSPIARSLISGLITGDLLKVGINKCLLVIDEQVKHPRAGHDVLPKWYRPVLFDDDVGIATDGSQPGTELLGIANGCRKGNNGDRLW